MKSPSERISQIPILAARVRRICIEELCARTRSQSVRRARQQVGWRLRNLPDHDYSLSEIARLFGRDHATVMVGIAAHRRRATAAASCVEHR